MHFLLEHEVLSGGVVAICAARPGAVAGVLFAWVLGLAHEFAMDFFMHQQSQLFGLYMTISAEPFDSGFAQGGFR